MTAGSSHLPRPAGSSDARRRARGDSGRQRRHWRRYASVALWAALAACDSAIGPEEGPTLVRFFNASQDATGPLTFTLSGGPAAVLPLGEGSAYAQVTPGVYGITIEDDESRWSVTGNLRVNRGLFQTIYAFGDASGEAAVVAGDEPVRPAEGQSLLRVFHLAGGIAGPVDLHILDVGQAVNPSAPGVPGMTFTAARDYFFVNAGQRRIVITAAGTANVLVDSGPLEFVSRAVYTAVFLNDETNAAAVVRLRDGE